MRRGFQLLLASSLLAGYAPAHSAGAATTLFDCSDASWSVQLFGKDNGKLVLSTRRLAGPPGTGIGASDCDEVRTGYVIGQQGGHQGHIRLSDGVRQIVLFEGMDGDLADRPGRSYAGAMTETASNPGQDFRIECPANPINASLLANINAWAQRVGVPMPAEEEEGGRFDGWF